MRFFLRVLYENFSQLKLKVPTNTYKCVCYLHLGFLCTVHEHINDIKGGDVVPLNTLNLQFVFVYQRFETAHNEARER